MEFDRNNAQYAACFCEENIWQLAGDLMERELISKNAFVLLLFNSHEVIAVQKQRAFPIGEIGFWDYHVILLDADNGQVFDLDTRLDCPISAKEYFTKTFPNQSSLPAEFRTMVRSVPVTEYLQRFSSDRKHMLDAKGSRLEEFPKWEPIVSENPIWLLDYLKADVPGSISSLSDADWILKSFRND